MYLVGESTLYIVHLNNAYVWASEAERKKMDENKETKRPYYCQSGFVFMFIGISLLIFAVYMGNAHKEVLPIGSATA